jgi:hypothetical protein
VVVEFIELENGAQTKMVMTQVGFPAPKLCQMVSQGTTESLDKLESLLGNQVLV